MTPMAVASQRAEKPCVARYTAPVKAKAEPPPCSSLPAYAEVMLDRLKSRQPMARMKIPIGTAFFAPTLSSAAPAIRLVTE